MNLAYKYPTIFWNCACLITDSGGAEDDPDETEEEKKERTKNNNYEKIALAIGKMKSAGVEVVPPDINDSLYTFRPNVEKNQIFFGLRGLVSVGEDLINTIIRNRPYSSIKDFLTRVKPNKQAMLSLIKSGAFDSLEPDRKFAMAWFLWEDCDKKKRLTLQNLNGLFKYGLVPEDTEERIFARRVYEFNRYLKAACKDKLDTRALNFLAELDLTNLITNNMLDMKAWEKYYHKQMDIYRRWLGEEGEQVLKKLNDLIFLGDWQARATGTLSNWEMQSMCFYYHDHELAHINSGKYGISDFSKLSRDPIVERTFTKAGRQIPIYKLFKICGTCIGKNKAKGTVTLLTSSGVVTVKFRKEMFAIFNKQISEINPDGTKSVKEKSWFSKGSMIMVMGIRSGDEFISKKYASSELAHQLYKINSIDEKGNLVLQSERYKGGIEEDGED